MRPRKAGEFAMRLARGLRLTVFVLGILSLSPTSARAQCLLCVAGFNPAPGHGPVSGSDNRRKIGIHIDASWGNPTNEKLWNAVQDAVNGWNNATDGGWHTGYYFEVTQNHELGYPSDITIAKDQCSGGATACMNMSFSQPAPATLKLNDLAVNGAAVLQIDVAADVMHEMAHFMGISRRTCGASNSTIMGGGNWSTGVNYSSLAPMPADVQMANNALNNPGGCTDPEQNATLPYEDSPVDTAGGEEVYNEPTYTENETEYYCDVHWWKTDYYVWSPGGWRYWYTTYEYLYYDNCQPLECCEDD
jgi:hypothetical protein